MTHGEKKYIIYLSDIVPLFAKGRKMQKKYLDMNVYDALQERLHFIFKEFDNIYVSFSGGKDSGLLLAVLMDFKRKYYPQRTVGLFHQDFEAQYSFTTEFVERTFKRYLNEVEPYWVCLPMATSTAVSNYEMFWYPWDDKKESLWVRPMPRHDYVVNLSNPFPHYRYKMHQEDLAKQFSRSYHEAHGGGKTVCLLGMRSDESLQRYSGFLNKKYGYKGECWLTKQFKDIWCASPIYDWSLHDVWGAIFKFGYDYNELYDLYYKAGLSPNQMRVASPFNEYAKDSLNLYRVIDPPTWAKLVGRVRGVNFGAIYSKTKALGYKSVTLPEGYTWKEYTLFLLSTLPPRMRKCYIEKFKTSIKFWHETGGGLSEVAIDELFRHGYKVARNGVSNYTLDKKWRIIFLSKIPDDTDDVKSTRDVPSWKRMCYCILKNDHACRYMGFGLTRTEQKTVNEIKKKYGEMILHE